MGILYEILRWRRIVYFLVDWLPDYWLGEWMDIGGWVGFNPAHSCLLVFIHLFCVVFLCK